jgi:hypothetical protein
MRKCLWLALLIPAAVAAQSRDDEIRMARSAAPVAVSKDAKVYVVDHGRYVVAVPGHSGEACMVIRWQGVYAPQCGDSEADATVLAVERFRAEQLLAGRTKAEVEHAISDGWSTGRFRKPARPALVFMLSSSQQLTDPTGAPIGKWFPHVMIFYPGMKESDVGVVSSSDVNIPGIVEPGMPMSAIVVVAREFVDPAPTP